MVASQQAAEGAGEGRQRGATHVWCTPRPFSQYADPEEFATLIAQAREPKSRAAPAPCLRAPMGQQNYRCYKET